MELRLKNLSKYRSQLIAIGILWVILFHARLLTLPIGNWIKLIGYGGVDICIFLSGLGIYYSVSKLSCTWIEFYKRRVIRILPTYIIIVFIYSIIMFYLGEIKNIDIFLNCTTLFYWLSPKMTFNWYIPAILFLYMITPIYYIIFKKTRYKRLLTFLVIVISILMCLLLNYIGISRFLMMVSRFPLYFIGFYYGNIICNYEIKITNKRMAIYFLELLFGLFWIKSLIGKPQYEWLLGKYCFYWYPFIFIVPSLSLLISKLFEFVKKNIKKNSWYYKYIVYLNRSLKYIGNNSLEFYLVNVSITMIGQKVISGQWVKSNAILYNLTIFFITVILILLKSILASDRAKPSR